VAKRQTPPDPGQQRPGETRKPVGYDKRLARVNRVARDSRAFALLNLGWPGLDRREAAVVRMHSDFRGFAQSRSNLGHPFFFDRLKKAKALGMSAGRIVNGRSPL
jgi:hypothetical protein